MKEYFLVGMSSDQDIVGGVRATIAFNNVVSSHQDTLSWSGNTLVLPESPEKQTWIVLEATLNWDVRYWDGGIGVNLMAMHATGSNTPGFQAYWRSAIGTYQAPQTILSMMIKSQTSFSSETIYVDVEVSNLAPGEPVILKATSTLLCYLVGHH